MNTFSSSQPIAMASQQTSLQPASDRAPFELIYGDAKDKLKEDTLTSIQQVYCNPVQIYQQPAEKSQDEKRELRFFNMRITDKFEKSSCEMLRVADIVGRLQNKPSANYEHQAAVEYLNKGGIDHYAQCNGIEFQQNLEAMSKKRILDARAEK